MQRLTHESFSPEEAVPTGSNRSFGLVMAVALGLFATLNWWRHGTAWPWTGGVAAFFLVAALLYPQLLGPLNRAWTAFGLLLHKVVNPVIMALLFFGTVLPTGLVMRALGKDPLRLQIDREAKSYWIKRHPRGPSSESMKDQF